MATLSLDDLLALRDDAVRAQVDDDFTHQWKNAPLVKSTFFSDDGGIWLPPADPSFVARVAAAAVCCEIAKSALYGFAACVNGGAAQSFLQKLNGDPSAIETWNGLYESYFPSKCTNGAGTSFQDYLDSNSDEAWDAVLYDHVTSKDYINLIMQRPTNDEDWLDEIRLVFYKLKLLGPTQVCDPNGCTDADASFLQPAIDAWNEAGASRLDASWATSFIPSPGLVVHPDDAADAVVNAITVQTLIKETHAPGRGSAPSTTRLTYEYGQAVVTFLQGVPPDLGFVNAGVSPNNTEIKTVH
jgi:hypothetical protein